MIGVIGLQLRLKLKELATLWFAYRHSMAWQKARRFGYFPLCMYGLLYDWRAIITRMANIWLRSQFYIQLVYKPHFGTWILLLGRLGSSGSKEKKCGFEFFWATFEGGFFNFLWAKNNLEFFWKHCSIDRSIHT